MRRPGNNMKEYEKLKYAVLRQPYTNLYARFYQDGKTVPASVTLTSLSEKAQYDKLDDEAKKILEKNGVILLMFNVPSGKTGGSDTTVFSAVKATGGVLAPMGEAEYKTTLMYRETSEFSKRNTGFGCRYQKIQLP